jgi:hypothetical protein
VRLVASAAAQIDKILKGANPAEIPIKRQNSSWTVRALNLTTPTSLFATADEVIERFWLGPQCAKLRHPPCYQKKRPSLSEVQQREEHRYRPRPAPYRGG